MIRWNWVLIIILTACTNEQPSTVAGLSLKVPVALVNYDDRFLALSTEDSSLVLKEKFDSTCCFNLVSLNDDMKTLLEVSNGSFLHYDNNEGKLHLSNSDSASVFILKDLGGSYLAFKSKDSTYLGHDSAGLYFTSSQSYANIFYAIYDPIFRHQEYNGYTKVQDYENQLIQNSRIRKTLMDKAKKRNLSFEDIVLLDAIWLYRRHGDFNFYESRAMFHYQNIIENEYLMKMMGEIGHKIGMTTIRMAWGYANYIMKREMGLSHVNK
jgi:hypothetical protein